jgi:hypothetical protein
VTGQTCLIPISVSGKRFSTENFLPALRAITKRYDRAVFLVADTLQMYNRAARADNAADICDLFGASERKIYLDERRTWLKKLRGDLGDSPIAAANWDIKGIDDFASADLSLIYRITVVLFTAEKRLRELVEEDAKRHVSANVNGVTDDVRLRLSRFYLLEELSVNIYLHCVEGIGDEYYLDSTLPSVRALYSGELTINAQGIVTRLGLHARMPAFHFYAFDERAGAWAVVPATERR